jgi:uncharacterized protein
MSASPNVGFFQPSRYVSLVFDETDGALIVFSARTGALGVVPPQDAELVRRALLPRARTPAPLVAPLADLIDGGFLVPEGTDEPALADADYVQRYAARHRQLIIMPTEQCNFRCVYCYETFARAQMSEELQLGLERFVDGERDIDFLAVNWFGGEPLLAASVVERLTGSFAASCASRDIPFQCAATTNGYLLTPELADTLIPLGLRYFQITIDGLADDHDERRPGAHGEPTFARIMANLDHLHRGDHDITVTLRHNYDPGNLPRVDDFCAMLAERFGADERFGVDLQAVGRWGGPNDASLDVCEGRSIPRAAVEAKWSALRHGLREVETLQLLRPAGAACYAADPRSLVIGSDGAVYKCTVELDQHDRNIVGRLHPDGHLDLDWSKVALWCETDGMHVGSKCTSCHFSPACRGAVCPKEWLDDGDCQCPKVKQTIGDSLLIARASSGA